MASNLVEKPQSNHFFEKLSASDTLNFNVKSSVLQCFSQSYSDLIAVKYCFVGFGSFSLYVVWRKVNRNW